MMTFASLIKNKLGLRADCKEYRAVCRACYSRKLLRNVAVVLSFAACYGFPVAAPAQTQTVTAPVIITPPTVDMFDENHVSLLTGKAYFSVPALELGDVSFTPYSYNGHYFTQGGLADQNYGRIAQCQTVALDGSYYGYGGAYECSVAATVDSNGVNVAFGLQAIHGQQRQTFVYMNGTYYPDDVVGYTDGSTFVDNVSTNGTCTWTQRDGTRIVYHAYHVSGSPLCHSNNIYQIIKPDGDTATYYYSGTFSTSDDSPSPIVSIATNRGYMLKYIYPGTPVWGAETSVVAVNSAFVACDPTSISCAITGTWPTATLSWQVKTTTPDNFLSYAGYVDQHYIFTITDAAHRQSVFELDSYYRVISYQPPGATKPVYTYKLCTQLDGIIRSDEQSTTYPIINCFGPIAGEWTKISSAGFDKQPMLWNLVSSSTHNGQTTHYTMGYDVGTVDSNNVVPATWIHTATNSQGLTMIATGGATTGLEGIKPPIESVTLYDGTKYLYEPNPRNNVFAETTPLGLTKVYSYDNAAPYYSMPGRGNLTQITRFPIAGHSQAATEQSATYPASCTNILTCNKPTSQTDANSHTTNFTYNPDNGELATVTGPADQNGVHPQTRYTYTKKYAYYSEGGSVKRADSGVWLLTRKSTCRTTSASGGSCAGGANDEIVTTYDYGPQDGTPNNLNLRGVSVTAEGADGALHTRTTCYEYDIYGHRIGTTQPKGVSGGSCG